MRTGEPGLFDRIKDKHFHDLLGISLYERRHQIKATQLSIPEKTLEMWEEQAGEPIPEVREWPVDGGPYVEIQVTFDNGWIRTLREIRREVS